MESHAILHVVQASYGDSLLLEYDQTLKKNSTTVQFMLIDGGPSRITRYYAMPAFGRPKYNLFSLLNWLSGDDTASKPENGILIGLETVVLTHDDEDHKQGVQDLFAALLRPATEKSNDFNVWKTGDRLLAAGKAPIKYIWYNSLENITAAINSPNAPVPKEQNWFDKQLSVYSSQPITPPVKSFNANLAVNSNNSTTFSMRDAQAVTGGQVMAGQFEITFIGPSKETLSKTQLATALRGVNSLNIPRYQFEDEMTSKTNKLSNSGLNKLIRLGNRLGLKADFDHSVKNLSSIAFVAEDRKKGISLLLLGDSTAEMFQNDYKKSKSVKSYTLMKIMHHGSYHNNFWKRDKDRENEEDILSDGRKTKGLTDLERSAVFFFVKVRAKQYVISASSLEMHPNPHSSTIIGIIAAARETAATIDIYLTNPLSPWVVSAVAKVLRENNMDLRYIGIHLLSNSAKSGAVAVYDHERDSNWEQYDTSGKDLWSTYSSSLASHFPEISKLDISYPIAPRIRKRKKGGLLDDSVLGRSEEWAPVTAIATVTSPAHQRESGHRFSYALGLDILGTSHRAVDTVQDLYEQSTTSPENSHARPQTQNNFVLSHQISTSVPPVLTWKRRSLRTILHTSLGDPRQLNHSELVETQSPTSKTLNSLHSTLQWLVEQKTISSVAAAKYEKEASNANGYNLAALLTLFIGVEESERLLAALPCDLASSTDYLSIDTSPSYWIATNYEAEVREFDDQSARGWCSIYSVSFTIGPPDNSEVSWDLPFGSASPLQASSTYNFTHDGPISLLIIWPAYITRMISGSYKGILRLDTKEYHINGELSLQYEQPTSYTMQFTDADYDISKCTISIADILNLFNTPDFDFSSSLKHLVLPALENVLDGLSDSVPLHNGCFILEKILSRVVLKEISADFLFDKIHQWNPFGSRRFSFDVSKLRVILSDISTSGNSLLSLRLDGDMNYAGTSSSSVTVPFELSAALTLQGFMLFEVAVLPGVNDSITIGQIFEIFGLPTSDLGMAFPAVADLSNRLSLSYLTAGWTSKVCPDYLSLTVAIDDWTILKDKLEVKEGSLEVQLGNLSSDSISVALHGWGVLEIKQIEVEIFFNMSHEQSHDGSRADFVNFQVAAQERAIQLGTVIEHFLGSDFTLLPVRFAALLNETAIESFIVEASRDGNRWTLSQIELAVRIEEKLDIFDKAQIHCPTLFVKIGYPLDKAKRTVYVCLNVTLHIGVMASKVAILLTSEEQTRIAAIFDAGSQSLSLNDVASAFIPAYKELSLPAALSFLASIAIQRATLAFELTNGKFRISEVLLSVVSTSTLELWEELSLQEVSLLFSYSKDKGTSVEFHAILSFAAGEDFLDFALLYDSTENLSSEVVEDTVASTALSGSWSASATYTGTISTFDILSRISGINLRDALKSVSLSGLADTLDISMSNLVVTLTKNSSVTEFSFDADTKWLFFSHLRFCCSKSSNWSYSFGFVVNPDANIVSYIPILGPLIENSVRFTNVAVVVFNRVLDKRALPPTLHVPETISQTGFNVAFAGRLSLSDKTLQALAKAINALDINILGIVGNKFMSLSVSVAPVVLFNGNMKLIGSVVVFCSEETKMAPNIGVRGDAVLDFGRQVSTEPIRTSLFLFINFSTTALCFNFTLCKWKAVFGYIGFDFENVEIGAQFPPEEFPVPSELTVRGSIKLEVNSAKFDGSVNMHFVEMDLIKSYAMGNINGLTLNNIIRAFSAAQNVPDFMDIGFGLLDFKLVPSDIWDSRAGQTIEKQFSMSGSFKMKPIHFEAHGAVDIRTSKVTVDGRLSPIIVIQKKLFSVLASSEEKPPPADTLAGASIYISVNDSGNPPGAKISGQTTFLGITNDIYFTLSQEGLRFSIARQWAIGGSLSGVIDKSHLELHASYSFSLNLTLPHVWIGSVSFGDIKILSFEATMDLTVDWTAVSWNLHIQGQFVVFGLEMKVTLTVGADIQDLNSLASKITAEIESIFNTVFVDAIRNLLDNLKTVFGILQSFGLKVWAVIKFLIESCGAALDTVMRAAREYFVLGWNEVARIMKDLGATAQQVINFLKELGCEAWSLAEAIAQAFGRIVRDTCARILKAADYLSKQIAQFFQDVFGDSAQDVIHVLLSLAFAPLEIAGIIIKLFSLSWSEVWEMITGSRDKTKEQVQEELLVAITVDLYKRSGQPSKVPDLTELPSLLEKHAIARFKDQFDVVYKGGDTIPPLTVSPPAVKALSTMCSFTDVSEVHVSDFMSQILKSMNLNSSMTDSAAKDLRVWTDGLTNEQSNNEWRDTILRHAYDTKDARDGSVRTLALLVYVNGSLTSDGIYATQTIIHYVGIYYDALSPASVARSQLQREAYASASMIMKHNIPIADDYSLELASINYGGTLFKDQFFFQYGSPPPDYKDNGTYIQVRTAGLGYFEDLKTDKVGEIVRNGLFSTIKLPEWISENIVEDIVSDYKNKIKMGTNGKWYSDYVDREYGVAQEEHNPVKVKGVIVAYTDTRIPTDVDVSVSIAYIFFMGVFYEVQTVKSAIYQDLIRLLYTNLKHDLENTDIHSSDLSSDLDGLKTLLARSTIYEFQEACHYDFADWETKPPDQSGDGMHVAKDFGEFADTDAISPWTSAKILRNSAFTFFDKVPAIGSDLHSQLNYWVKSLEDDIIPNQWNYRQFSKSYEHPSDDTKVLKTDSYFIFACGSLTESGQCLKLYFLYLVAVFYVAKKPGGNPDDDI